MSGDRVAIYKCGCCGESFKSTPDIARFYDQDEGYSICEKCAQWSAEYRQIFKINILRHIAAGGWPTDRCIQYLKLIRGFDNDGTQRA